MLVSIVEDLSHSLCRILGYIEMGKDVLYDGQAFRVLKPVKPTMHATEGESASELEIPQCITLRVKQQRDRFILHCDMSQFKDDDERDDIRNYFATEMEM